MLRKWGSAVVAAAMLASTVSYAGTETQQQGALAPGKAAGVHEATVFGVPWTMALLFTAATVAVIIIATSDNGNSSANSTTSNPP
jgi:hypothetical protein